MRSKSLFIGFLIGFFPCFSQQTMEHHLLIELLENSALKNENSADINTLLEHYTGLYESPININEVSYFELIESRLFSPAQAQELISYRAYYGSFIEKNELVTLESLSEKEAQFIEHFITLSPTGNKKSLFKNGTHEIVSRSSRALEEKAGFKNNTYSGGPNKHFLRYRCLMNNGSSYGITVEKDAGEAFHFSKNNHKLGFDFLSYHFFVQPDASSTKLGIGDYKLQFGQGLHFWNGFNLGKSMYTTSIANHGYELSPYTSANESLNLRGIAIRTGTKWNNTSFISIKGVDGNITSKNEFSAFQTSGLHRTDHEIQDQEKVKETIIGSRLSYRGEQLKLGITSSYTQFSYTLNKGDALYNRHHFSGNNYYTSSFDYNYFKKNMELFGEFSLLWNHDLAYINGIKYIHSSRNELVIAHRYYGKSYFSRYSNAFSESTQPTNEKGIYIGHKINLHKNWVLHSYVDVYQFPWLRFNVPSPNTKGIDYQTQLTFEPNTHLTLSIRYKHETKDEKSTTNETQIPAIAKRNTTRLRLHSNYNFNERLTLRTRFEYNGVSTSPILGPSQRTGLLVYQDISYSFLTYNRLKLSVRYAFFNTSSFDNRIYAYESDVRYAFSTPSYFNKGNRIYFMINYRLSKAMSFWLRYARFYYFNQASNGSGNEEIQGPYKSEIKLQVIFKLS